MYELLKVLFLGLFGVAYAAEIQRVNQQSSVSVATQSTALARALKSRRARRRAHKVRSLRGQKGLSDVITEEDDSDDDDDDDDDDKAEVSEKHSAGPIKDAHAASTALYKGTAEAGKQSAQSAQLINQQIRLKAEAAAKARKAEEEKERKRKEAKKALEDAKEAKEEADDKLEAFTDDKEFEAKIAKQTKVMTNETQSPVLASFLGEFRSEMREYAMPAYPKYLQGRLDAANEKVKALELELQNQESAAKANKTQVEAKKKAAEEKKALEEDKAVASSVKKDSQEAASRGKKADESLEDEETEKVVKKTKAAADAEEDAQEEAKEVAQKAGETFAISFFANVALLAVIFAMASAKDSIVRTHTWYLIDQVVCIFLAVMYFNAFDSMLDFHALGVNSSLIASILHAIFMLAMVLGLAVALRNPSKETSLAVVCGAGAHIVSFSSVHAASATQVMLVSESYTYSMCFFGLFVLLLGLGIVGFIVYRAKVSMELDQNDSWMDKTDDVENDFGAMAFSVAFTMLVRFVITGHHPTNGEAKFDHEYSDRIKMLIWAVFCLIVAGFVVKFCSKEAAVARAVTPATWRSYAKVRVMTFVTTVAAMNVAWAWLFWGEWTFFETLYAGEAVKGRVMFAVTMTIAACLGLVGISKMNAAREMKNETKVILTALGLVVAWSWELCFDAAIEDMCEGVSHPVSWKVATTLLLAAIVIPVYALYMRPLVERVTNITKQ